MSFLAILEVLNFDFSQFEQLSSPKFTKIQSFESLKLPKMTFLHRSNALKFDFTQNRSGGKIIKFQQSQALTSHFESFWSRYLHKNIFGNYATFLGQTYKKSQFSLSNFLHIWQHCSY